MRFINPKTDFAFKKIFGSEQSREVLISFLNGLLYDGQDAIEMSSQDTVPFCMWCVAGNLDHYKNAIWKTVEGLGDRDTTCAIVGGIVASAASADIPQDWLGKRESLDDWEISEERWGF